MAPREKGFGGEPQRRRRAAPAGRTLKRSPACTTPRIERQATDLARGEALGAGQLPDLRQDLGGRHGALTAGLGSARQRQRDKRHWAGERFTRLGALGHHASRSGEGGRQAALAQLGQGPAARGIPTSRGMPPARRSRGLARRRSSSSSESWAVHPDDRGGGGTSLTKEIPSAPRLEEEMRSQRQQLRIRLHAHLAHDLLGELPGRREPRHFPP